MRDLLAAAGLPLAGVRESFGDFVVADSGGRPVASAGLERHGEVGLLRSVVVDPAFRGAGLGALLTELVLARAREQRLKAVYLLTTTAAEFFARLGFRRIERVELPPSLSASEELRGACPDTAVAMIRDLASG
ncbi:MAG: arsenic resistance N-acetyltransferase ArsN2 [Gemmatimonadales bacterium]